MACFKIAASSSGEYGSSLSRNANRDASARAISFGSLVAAISVIRGISNAICRDSLPERTVMVMRLSSSAS